MFDIQEFVNRFRGGEQSRYRLVPLDEWANDGEPLAIHPPAIVGRNRNADLHLNDPWVSRTHCELRERRGGLEVRDLESRHGVYVNNRRVAEATLQAGDVLLVGVSRFRVECDEE